MKEPVIAEIKVIPVGTATTSLSRHIAACMYILKQAEDVSYQLTAMGTIVWGPLERVLEVARQMHEQPFEMGEKRVVTSISIDDRRDKPVTMESKVQAVIEAGSGR